MRETQSRFAVSRTPSVHRRSAPCHFLAVLVLALLWLGTPARAFDTNADHYYLMAYFNNEAAGLKYALSTDAAAWENLPAPSLPAQPIRGGVGLGSWRTQVEFQNLSVTSGTQELFADDFSTGASPWATWAGTWQRDHGIWGQSADIAPALAAAHAGGPWTNYTYRLRARKTGGSEGFLVLFGIRDQDHYYWWNIGGWNNSRMQLEKTVQKARAPLGPSVPHHLELNRWYELKIVLTDARIQCYLDGKLMIDCADATVQTWLVPGVDGRIMRDPSLGQAQDGVYHCVWTSSWGSRNIGHASSKDLIHWSAQEVFPVMSSVPHTAMSWAPEIFYDDVQQRSMIFWSSGVNRVCSCWYVTTLDFKTYSAPKILFTSGNGSYGGQAGAQGAIDFYLLKDRAARYLLFYKKDDNSGTHPVNYYRIGPTPEGPWGEEIGPMIPKGIGGEGPAVLKLGSEYRCYVDPQSSGFLFYYSSPDLLHWQQHETTLPFSHGEPIEIPRAIALGLSAASSSEAGGHP